MKKKIDIFNDGIRQGYRAGFDHGYQTALDDLRKELTEPRTTLQWEDLRNGKVYTGTAEDQA